MERINFQKSLILHAKLALGQTEYNKIDYPVSKFWRKDCNIYEIMEIRRLTHLTDNFHSSWGINGYITAKVFQLAVAYTENRIVFQIEETDMLYEKQYDVKPADVVRFNEIIKNGFSIGAFKNNELIGVLICDIRPWNNSFYIEYVSVSALYRRKGIGKTLIRHAIKLCQQNNCRIIELETQNTNVPAIEFYSKQGFKITGLNSKLYNASNLEVALFMTFENDAYSVEKPVER